MMDCPVRGFPVSEFEARLERVQKRIAAEDLPGCMLMTEPEVPFFIRFHTLFWQSLTLSWFHFIPADK